MFSEEIIQDLISRAIAARQRAYVPYSGFPVGAALLTKSGQIYTGCNIENASYGLTICAERNAATTAVASGALTFEKIAIVSNASMPWPCGACRQFLNEFSPTMEVIVQGGDGHTERAKLNELLPNSFGPQSL